jgi:hypothetical protein
MMARLASVQLLLGAPGENHLSLRPLHRAAPDSTDYWEANWLKVNVAVRAGAFAGGFEADLRTDELLDFATQLAALEGATTGAAALQSAEGWVSVKLALAPGGRLEGACEVRDDPAMGSSLRFQLTVEPGQRPALLDGLGAVLRAFPVVGDPAAEPAALLGDDEGEDGPEPERG